MDSVAWRSVLVVSCPNFVLFYCAHTINEINAFLFILIKNAYKIVVAENWNEQTIEET
jgi:hypothetical protein